MVHFFHRGANKKNNLKNSQVRDGLNISDIAKHLRETKVSVFTEYWHYYTWEHEIKERPWLTEYCTNENFIGDCLSEIFKNRKKSGDECSFYGRLITSLTYDHFDFEWDNLRETFMRDKQHLEKRLQCDALW